MQFARQKHCDSFRGLLDEDLHVGTLTVQSSGPHTKSSG